MVYVSIAIFLLLSIVLSGIGLGGGALYVPVLLGLGFNVHNAAGISLFLITVTGFAAFSRFYKAGLVDWKLAVIMDTFTDIGAFVGGMTAIKISAFYLKFVLALILIIAAVLMVIGLNRTQQKTYLKGFGSWHRQFGEHSYDVNLLFVIPVTFIIGYLSGALGIAGGLLKIPMMVLLFGVPQKIAAATSSLMVGLTGLFGLAGHGISTGIDWKLAVALGIVVLVGARLGAHISIQVSNKKLKKWTAGVFSFIGIWMIVNLFI